MAKVMLDKNGLARSAGTLTVYNFDAASGEFTGSNDEYLAQGVGLPANACVTAPPVIEAGQAAVYRDGNWQVVADHRGETVYSVADGSAIVLSELGDYPADTTPLAPATAWDKWDGEKWVTDADAQQAADVKSAARQKSALISEANAVTQAWQTQLLLGIITDADKVTLTKWMKYIQAVQAVDVSESPEISWPSPPDIA
ncbi:TPA: tail fiber assembly protein [Escherichia coli]|uniref:Tail fiber assembly protein n=1 Tax=Enterobacter roggenkampii TaxID=1812935 RepID=A0AAX1WF26_9ENTR|nr:MULTISPECIES: tail fiber assembly protein [Enterobacteriaceae]ECS5801708.1 tail fiber assembly protein [Salmonella enterica subsp. enterica serovar Newport]EGC8089730.1 tail fiber assembly protein [Salmonella enterica]EKY0587801.1 tail fiber assembly protein [Escherichia coli]EMB7756810.1 tail fiber assembly protein [Serratia marcescens]HCB1815529.1 tail fiber assembly protein [Citrobacter braakii]